MYGLFIEAVKMSQIRVAKVFQSFVLQVLARCPNGLELQRVYDEIERSFPLLSQWRRSIPTTAGFKEMYALSYEDWEEVPQDIMRARIPSEPFWQMETRYVRLPLKKAGFLDLQVPRGTWRLSSSGRQAASQHQLILELNDDERSITTIRAV
jgi:hypothetical protein